jgi:LSD1 subclass zinc finger protein
VPTALHCPSCSAPVSFPAGAAAATCSYCGAQIRDVAPGAAPPISVLAEGLAIRTPSGMIVPLLEAGAGLPITKAETLSTSRDGQDRITCELVTATPSPRALAYLEVAVARSAPRGVPRAALVLRVSANGDASASLAGENGDANASFRVGTSRPR